jgi:hypothetical protein
VRRIRIGNLYGSDRDVYSTRSNKASADRTKDRAAWACERSNTNGGDASNDQDSAKPQVLIAVLLLLGRAGVPGDPSCGVFPLNRSNQF